jgi:hypothetical protein
MKGDGWYLLAESNTARLSKSVNQYLHMGFEPCGNAFAVYGVFFGKEQIWHYQAVRRGDPDPEEFKEEM